MAKKYDAYDLSYRNQNKGAYEEPENDRSDRSFSSMADFNERFADLFKGRENTYNLNGNIYYKGTKIHSASDYVPDVKKETIDKKGKVKSTSKTNVHTVVIILMVISVISHALAELDENSVDKFFNAVRDLIVSNIDIYSGNDSGSNDVSDSSEGNADDSLFDDKFDKKKYDEIKKSLKMPRSKPVKGEGEINVCGKLFTLGMSAKDVADMGFSFDEVRDNDTGELKELHLVYPNDNAVYDMVTCYFALNQGGDKDNFEDYNLTSLYTSYWYAVEDDTQIYYNAEIIYGIKTDMTYDEAKKIVEDSGVEDPVFYEDGDYPSILWIGENCFYYVMADHGYVSQFSVESIN